MTSKTLAAIESAACPGYTSPVTNRHYPGTTHQLITRNGVRCAVCGVAEPILREGLTIPSTADDALTEPCDACGASGGEPCEPLCIGRAAWLDTIPTGTAGE